MKKKEIQRLVFGLLLICSFFMFQSSEGGEACDSFCNSDSNDGKLRVYNSAESAGSIFVTVDIIGDTAIIKPGKNVIFYLEQGSYRVVAKQTGFNGQLVGTKVISILSGDETRITFYN